MKYFVKEYSDAFKGMLSTLKPVCQFDNIETGYNCSSRPNGYDALSGGKERQYVAMLLECWAFIIIIFIIII